MSQRKEKRNRRAARKNPPSETSYSHSLFDMLYEQAQKNAVLSPPPSPASSIVSSVQRRSTVHPLSITLEPAVVLYVMEFFERGGPAAWEVEEARAFGHTLASQGDTLLYRSNKPGETADLFNGFARSIAVLAHSPGGVPLFGQCLDAEQIVAGFVGAETAKAYINESVKRYNREVVTEIQASLSLESATPVRTWNVIRWFELASDADLLQIRVEGYTNTAFEDRLKADGIAAHVLAFVLERVEREVEGMFIQRELTEEERQRLAQAQQLLQARGQGHPIGCCIDATQAEEWLYVFKHALWRKR